MKIIKDNKNWKLWWIGIQVTCSECGRIVELDDGDQNAYWWMVTNKRDRICIMCCECRQIIEVSRNDKHFPPQLPKSEASPELDDLLVPDPLGGHKRVWWL